MHVLWFVFWIWWVTSVRTWGQLDTQWGQKLEFQSVWTWRQLSAYTQWRHCNTAGRGSVSAQYHRYSHRYEFQPGSARLLPAAVVFLSPCFPSRLTWRPHGVCSPFSWCPHLTLHFLVTDWSFGLLPQTGYWWPWLLVSVLSHVIGLPSQFPSGWTLRQKTQTPQTIPKQLENMQAEIKSRITAQQIVNKHTK